MVLISKSIGKSQCLLLLGIISAVAFPFSSRAAELLRNVDSSAVRSFMAPENYAGHYELRRILFRAKKYRIVQINFAVFEQPNVEFTITPWSGLQLKVRQTQNGVPYDFEGVRGWSGEVLSVNNAPRSPDQPALADFWIQSSPYVVPIWAAKKLRNKERREPLIAKKLVPQDLTGVSSSNPNAMVKVDVRTIMGTISGVAEGDITITPVMEDPRYFVVTQEDSDKFQTSIEGDSDQGKIERIERFNKQIANEMSREFATDR